MKQHFVIDTSVYLTYAAYDKLYRLVNAAKFYGLTIYINENIIDEFVKNLPIVIRVANPDIEKMLGDILNMATFKNTFSIFTSSPDPKDNFLFDLAIQTNSEVIVTQEKILLSFAESPVSIHDLKWFKETYPVPL